MTPRSAAPIPVLPHPGPAPGCAPCPAGLWLARQQSDQGAAAVLRAPRSVPGYAGDAKDNPKPVLVRGLGLKDPSRSLCTAAGEPGVASSRIGELPVALGLLKAVSLPLCDLTRSVGSPITQGMPTGSMTARRAAGPAMASPIAIENFWQ
jgi:hypothetical protein